VRIKEETQKIIHYVHVHTTRRKEVYIKSIRSVSYIEEHKRMAWGCRGCSRNPNAEKLTIIRAKIFKIWAKYAATFTCK